MRGVLERCILLSITAHNCFQRNSRWRSAPVVEVTIPTFMSPLRSNVKADYIKEEYECQISTLKQQDTHVLLHSFANGL